MKITIIFFTMLTLISCATPTTVQRASDYEICRLSLLRPPLQSDIAINEADRQIKVRGLNCNSYAGTIFQRQQEGLNQLMQQPKKQEQQQIRKPTQTTCYKNGQYVNCTTY